MRTAEIVASRILFWGGVLSVALMAIGVAGALGRTAELPVIYASVGQVVRALAQWPVEPLAIVATGILLLLATPALSLVAVLVVFLSAGDRRYAGITLLLLAALSVSLIFVSGRR